MRLINCFSFALLSVLQTDINKFVKKNNVLIIDLKIDFVSKHAILIYETIDK